MVNKKALLAARIRKRISAHSGEPKIENPRAAHWPRLWEIIAASLPARVCTRTRRTLTLAGSGKKEEREAAESAATDIQEISDRYERAAWPTLRAPYLLGILVGSSEPKSERAAAHYWPFKPASSSLRSFFLYIRAEFSYFDWYYFFKANSSIKSRY